MSPSVISIALLATVLASTLALQPTNPLLPGQNPNRNRNQNGLNQQNRQNLLNLVQACEQYQPRNLPNIYPPRNNINKNQAQQQANRNNKNIAQNPCTALYNQLGLNNINGQPPQQPRNGQIVPPRTAPSCQGQRLNQNNQLPILPPQNILKNEIPVEICSSFVECSRGSQCCAVSQSNILGLSLTRFNLPIIGQCRRICPVNEINL